MYDQLASKVGSIRSSTTQRTRFISCRTRKGSARSIELRLRICQWRRNSIKPQPHRFQVSRLLATDGKIRRLREVMFLANLSFAGLKCPANLRHELLRRPGGCVGRCKQDSVSFDERQRGVQRLGDGRRDVQRKNRTLRILLCGGEQPQVFPFCKDSKAGSTK